MHGPYTAKIEIRGQEPLLLSEDELAEGDRIAGRFYQEAGVGTLVGATRAAVFTAALLLAPDEAAEVEILGRVGTEPRATDVGATLNRVRRDAAGRVFSTLGSRFSEREFKSPALAIAERVVKAADYYRLCDEAEALGIPTSLDDPRSPKTVAALRAAVKSALATATA